MKTFGPTASIVDPGWDTPSHRTDLAYAVGRIGGCNLTIDGPPDPESLRFSFELDADDPAAATAATRLLSTSLHVRLGYLITAQASASLHLVHGGEGLW